MAQTQTLTSKKLNRSVDQTLFSGLSGEIESRYQDLRDRVEDLSEQSVKVVKKHPYYAILGAAAAGIAIGMFFSRKK